MSSELIARAIIIFAAEISSTFRLGFRGGSLDQILRQKDPGLLKAVEHLSKNEIAIGVQMLQQQGRVTEVVDPQQHIEAIAKSYAAIQKTLSSFVPTTLRVVRSTRPRDRSCTRSTPWTRKIIPCAC